MARYIQIQDELKQIRYRQEQLRKESKEIEFNLVQELRYKFPDQNPSIETNRGTLKVCKQKQQQSLTYKFIGQALQKHLKDEHIDMVISTLKEERKSQMFDIIKYIPIQ